MNVLRNIWTDLVEKKLWPVAAVLVVALVAVPLAMSGGGDDAQPTPAVAETAAPAKEPAVSLDTSVRDTPKHRKGGVRDPFKQLHIPKPKAEAKAVAAAPVVTPGGGARVTPTPTPSTTTPNVTPSTTGSTLTYFTYRVGIRFGRAGKLRSHRDVKRLTALPSSTFPFFTYMGVLEDRNTAVFMVNADVAASGDGTCRPSAKRCQLLELKPGDSAKLVYHPTDGRDPITYRLELSSVKQVTTGSQAKAARAKSAVNAKGSAALNALRAAKLVPQIHRYVYSRKTGLLRRATGKRAAKAAAARVPKRMALDTRWGWVAKLNGGVFFSPSKSVSAS
jgi:hypothetical protein